MSDYNNSSNYYSGNESSPNLSEEIISNKRQKLSNQQQDANNGSDFLNFDYNTMVDATTNNATIPEDFFMFVADNNQDINNVVNAQASMHSSASSITSPLQQQQQNMQPLQQNVQPLQQQQMPTQPSMQPQQQQQQLQQQLQQQQQSKQQQIPFNSDPPNQTVHTIIVGGRSFRLSWESLKSDGPNNFFLEYFRKKKSSKTMHIDRDPDTFELIVRHLRGYYIRSQDDIQHQSLLCDAIYYGLNRLRKTLQEQLYINVGGRVFQLPWNLFRKGKKTYQQKFHTQSSYILYTKINKQNKTAPIIFLRGLLCIRYYRLTQMTEIHHQSTLTKILTFLQIL